MSEGMVRLRYSTVVNYLSMIYRLVISVGFTVIVARKLAPSDFGVWGITLSTTLMLANLWGIIGFWMRRGIARGEPHALKAGTLGALIYSGIAAGAHIALGAAQSAMFGWPFEAFLASVPMTVSAVMDRYLSTAVSMVKPEGVGYKNIALDTARFVSATILIYLIGRVVYTPIFAYTLGFIVSSTVSLMILLKLGLRPLPGAARVLTGWVKAAYIPIANVARLSLLSGARALASWATGSELSVAYLNVGFSTQTAIVRASAQSTPALYARLLKGRGGEDVEEVLRLFILLTGYMTASFIVLSRTIASLYNPLYVDAWAVVTIVALFGVAEGIGNILTVSAWGSVRSERLSWTDLRRTPLFKVTYARLGSLIVSLIAGSMLSSAAIPNYLLAAEYFAGSLLAGSAAYALWVSAYVREAVAFKVPWREVWAGVAASLTVSLYYVVTGLSNLVIKSFWSSAPILLFHGLIALIIYAVVWATISTWFRDLLRASVNYIGAFLRSNAG